MHRIVVMQWSRLGDVLQTRPLLNHIARRAPQAQITLCADARYASVVAAMSEQVEFWPIDLASLSALSRHSVSQGQAMSGLMTMSEAFIGHGADEVYVLSRSLAACIFAELLRPTVIFGYRRSGLSVVTPEPVARLEETVRAEHRVAVHLSDVWTCLDGAERAPQWMKPLKAVRNDTVEETHNRRIGLLCDAGESYRMIPGEWLARLASALRDDGCTQLTLFAARASEDKSDPLTLLASTHDRMSDLRGHLTLEGFADGLAQQDVVIGPDSGGLHLAAALNVPVLGLYFGGASCRATGPYTDRALVIQDPNWNDASTTNVVDCVTQLAERKPITLRDANIFAPRIDEYGLCYASPCWPVQVCDTMSESRGEFFKRSAISERLPRHSGLRDALDSSGISIIVPECGQTHYTDELLEHLVVDVATLSAEIIVVSSGDGVYHRCNLSPSTVKQLCNDTSLSFAQACNLGAAQARFNRLLFLNNDAYFPAGQLVRFLDGAPDGVISSPIIRYPDGLIQNGGVSLRDGRVVELGHGLADLPEEANCADAVSAVALLVNKNIFDSFGGFDESYVNGYEDLDFCLRAGKNGIRSVVVDSAHIVHYRGSSVGRFAHEDANWNRFSRKWSAALGTTLPMRLCNRNRAVAPLVVVSTEPADAAGSRLRWVWPLEAMNLKLDEDFVWLRESEFLSEPDEFQRLVTAAESVVVFRALESDALQTRLLAATKQSRARLLVDSDDLFLNRFSEKSSRGKARSDFEVRFRKLLDHASIITASTSPLTETLSAEGYSARHVPTLPHTRLWDNMPQFAQSDEHVRIGFFGTASHMLDLGSIVPALAQILDECPQARFFWWGCRPGELAYHPHVRQGGPMVQNYETHLQRLYRFGLDMALVPLLDTTASRVKSPVKYFEYASAGIPAIYSALAPYTNIVEQGRTGLLAAETTRSWVEAIRMLLDDPKLRSSIANEALADVRARAQDETSRAILESIVRRLLTHRVIVPVDTIARQPEACT